MAAPPRRTLGDGRPYCRIAGGADRRTQPLYRVGRAPSSPCPARCCDPPPRCRKPPRPASPRRATHQSPPHSAPSRAPHGGLAANTGSRRGPTHAAAAFSLGDDLSRHAPCGYGTGKRRGGLPYGHRCRIQPSRPCHRAGDTAPLASRLPQQSAPRLPPRSPPPRRRRDGVAAGTGVSQRPPQRSQSAQKQRLQRTGPRGTRHRAALDV